MILYRVCQTITRLAWPAIGTLRVAGVENVPRQGPFILIANHQSIIDPILIQTVCPRPLHTMAKSTQFASPPMAWLMTRLKSFPVRRFEVDPQAVRTALRRLAEGHGVGIYIEGERSWDGRLQEFRLGTVRLILKAGVPVIPTAIAGSYDAWPRWDRRVRRADVRIAFGPPIVWPPMHRRADRESELPHALQLLRAAVARLLATAQPRDPAAVTAATDALPASSPPGGKASGA